MLRIEIASLRIEVSHPADQGTLRDFLGSVLSPSLPAISEAPRIVAAEPLTATPASPLLPANKAKTSIAEGSGSTCPKPKKATRGKTGSNGWTAESEKKVQKILKALKKHGPLSRSEAARKAGLIPTQALRFFKDPRFQFNETGSLAYIAGEAWPTSESDEAEYEYEYEEETESEADDEEEVDSPPPLKPIEPGLEQVPRDTDPAVVKIARHLRRVGGKHFDYLAADMDLAPQQLRTLAEHEWFVKFQSPGGGSSLRLSDAGKLAMGLAVEGIS